jgi:hypothetical protein
MIVNHMKYKASITTPILFLYIEEAPNVPHDVKRLVGSLLKQLIHFRTASVSPHIKDTWKQLKNETPSEDVIKSLFAVS